MKKHLTCGAFGLLAASLLAAHSAPQDEIKAAAAKLGNDYSWKTTLDIAGSGRGFGGATEGKTVKGQTWISRTARDMTIEAYLSGTNKGAIKTPEGWRTLTEAAGDDSGGFNPFMFTARMLQIFKAPAVQATELAAQARELKADGDAIAGDLTEAGAKSLLTFRPPGGGDEPQVRNAKGSVKYWVKDGQLVKYQSKVQGTLSFEDSDRDVDHTTTVEFKDMGATKIEVPEEAKKKLQ